MRFLGILFMGLILAQPALAQTNSSGPHSFGTITCPQRVPCPEDNNTIPTSTLVAATNACITQYSGYTSPSGFFDEIAGLDSSSCLTSLPNTIPKGMGAQLIPHCCIVKLQENICSFRCDMMSQ